MSLKNATTIDAYEKTSLYFLANEVKYEDESPNDAGQEKATMEHYIDRYFVGADKDAEFFEIGAGGGQASWYMRKCGLRVTPSDAASAMVEQMKIRRQLCAIKFNATKDKYPTGKKYRGIFCWRVFPHFTPEDSEAALRNAYDALEPGGVMILNVMNRTKHGGAESEWTDFGEPFRLGRKLFFYYYTEEQLRDIIYAVGFRSVECHEEHDGAWLVFVLRK